MKVVVDTMVLIWRFDQRSTADDPHRKEMQYRTDALMTIVEEEGKQLIIPTDSIAELLVPMTERQRESFLAEVQRQFYCPTFDIKAAALAASLHAAHNSSDKSEQYEKRAILKADIKIIAAAKAAGAIEFYSHDRRARALASSIMIAKDLPKQHPNFVVDQEIRGVILDSKKPSKK